MSNQTDQQLIDAARHADWMQVVLNQGPPCFHYEADNARFCLRAQRWAGHVDGGEYPEHTYVPLDALLSATASDACASLRAQVQALQQELAKEERAHNQTVDERDRAQEAADELAYAIAPIEAIGEHSNLNDPWANALEEIESIKERAEAWGLLNQARALDQQTVARANERAEAAAAEIARIRLLPDEWRARAKAQRELAESEDACNPTALLAMADANDDRADDLAAALTSAPEGTRP